MTPPKRCRFLLPRRALGIGLLVATVACASASERGPRTVSSSRDPQIARELARHGIHPVGAERELEETLPADLMSGAAWGTKIGPCRAGGYDLTRAAGHTVQMLRYEIDDEIRDEPLYAWVVMDAGTLVCVFRSVREGSEMAPGVFPASGD